LDDEDLQNLISGLINFGLGVAATMSGQPWLMGVAAPLKVLTKRAVQMWTGGSNQPTRAFAVSGKQSLVAYRPPWGVEADLIPLWQGQTVLTQEITGQFTTSGAGGRRLRFGDPVGLVITSASWQSQDNGLVVPAKFGEPFRIRIPWGDYNLSAYSLESNSQPRVDPVTAIGVGHVPPALTAQTRPIALQQRQTVMTRSLLTDLRREATSVKISKCPRCKTMLYVQLFTCPKCGYLLLGSLAKQQVPALGTVRCLKCGKFNFAVSANCYTCGASLSIAKILQGIN
jgi:hypothetical protein